ELAEDARFASDELRRTNEPALAEAICAWAGSHTVDSAVAALSAANIPTAPLSSAREAWASDQVAARGLASEVDHPQLGTLNLPEQPVQFAGSPRGGRRAAPNLDEHGAQIRAELER